MGEMLILIGASDICFMGGSLIGDKVGGHNVLEPAALGVPIITGPSYYNFEDIVNELLTNGQLTLIDSPATLAESLIHRLEQTTTHTQVKNSLSSRGAIHCVLEQVQ